MVLPSAITYDGLPISRGGAHRLRTRGVRAGLSAVRRFAQAVSLQPEPSDLRIEVLAGGGVPPAFSDPLIAEFDARFATARVRRIGAFTGRQWTIGPSDLDPLAARLDAAAPPAAGPAGSSVVIHATWRLVLFDPSTRRPLPGQDRDSYLGLDAAPGCPLGRSFVYASLAGASTARLFLSLPFDDAAPEARRLAAAVRAAFPVPLSPQHWKLWRLSRAGDSYVGRRIAAPFAPSGR